MEADLGIDPPPASDVDALQEQLRRFEVCPSESLVNTCGVELSIPV